MPGILNALSISNRAAIIGIKDRLYLTVIACKYFPTKLTRLGKHDLLLISVAAVFFYLFVIEARENILRSANLLNVKDGIDKRADV